MATVDDIVTAFGTAGITIEADSGFGPTGQNILNAIENAEEKNILQVMDKRPDNELMNGTFGRIIEGRAIMYSIAKRDTIAITNFETWWSVLCSDGTGNLLNNTISPTDLGDLKFWHWRAIDNLASFAEREGNVFVVTQLADFAIN